MAFAAPCRRSTSGRTGASRSAKFRRIGDIKPVAARRRARRHRSRRRASACSPSRDKSGDCRPRARDRHRRRSTASNGRVRPASADALAARRRHLCRADRRQARPIPVAPDSGDLRRAASRWTRSPAACFAMVGGFSFDQSEFNRATQALRQPGSSFKPIVYAAALDNGYTPSSIVLDEPIEIDEGNGEIWRPENFEGKSGGPHTLRYGIEHSINQMTVRLARDIGMPLIVEYAKRFGVYDNLPPYLSMSLGAGETTVLRMVTAYSMFDNGGKRDQGDADRPHPGSLGPYDLPARRAHLRGLRRRPWDNQAEPKLIDKREQVHRSAHRLPDHLDHGRRHPARHRHRDQRRRQASRRQDRHHQRRQGPVVRRLFAQPRLRRLHGLRPAALARRQAPRRRTTPRRSSAIS